MFFSVGTLLLKLNSLTTILLLPVVESDFTMYKTDTFTQLVNIFKNDFGGVRK